MELTAWWFADGKIGHENQSHALIEALESRLKLRAYRINVPPLTITGEARRLLQWLFGQYPAGDSLPAPDLLVGAGRATQTPMLAARKARGGRAIVIMRPTLPIALFDLCIVPEHDQVPARENVIVTMGALTRVSAAGPRDPALGLILLGGPSSHHAWSDGGLIEQVEEITKREPNMSWLLTTSRRTPVSTLARLEEHALPNLRVVPFQHTDLDWLPGQLSRASRVWVTEDSVSMVYEALSAGAATGLLSVPRVSVGRVVLGLDRLIARGLVTPYARWRDGEALRAAPEPLREAQRCADEIIRRWKLGAE